MNSLPIDSPWARVPIGACDAAELDPELAGLLAQMAATPADPPTTGDLVGSAEDVLIVVAQLRCARYGHQIGAVLHLDRTHRELPPLLLAELCQSEVGRWISEETAAGQVSAGSRLAEIDAVALDASLGPQHRYAEIDCLGDVGTMHSVAVAELLDAGRRGYAKRLRATRGDRRPTPIRVKLDHAHPTWSPCTLAALRDDPDGHGVA